MPRRSRRTASQITERSEEEEEVLSQASSTSNMEEDIPHDAKVKDGVSKFDQILTELRDFRKENKEQLDAMREDMSGIINRMDEAEERIISAETHIQATEEMLIELTKRQTQVESKLMDLEGRLRRENIRIYGVTEGAENSSSSVINFVETLLGNGLGLPSSLTLDIERAHRALGPKPPAGASPRSFVVKFASYRRKEDILKRAWQAKGFDFQGKKIYLDNDYAPEVQRKRKEYTAAKATLREKNIRFQTPFPARLRVHYSDGTVMYNSAQEATEDMVKRGLSVNIVKNPVPLFEQLKQQIWLISGKKGKKGDVSQMPGFKEKLRAFRRQDDCVRTVSLDLLIECVNALFNTVSNYFWVL